MESINAAEDPVSTNSVQTALHYCSWLPERPASEYLNVTGDNDHNSQMKTYESSLHVHKGYLAIQAALNYSTCLPVPSRETEKLGEREQNGMTCFT